jgi:hypothetical protein
MQIGIGLMLASALLFNLINRTVISAGRLVNYFWPCHQSPLTSFPCYAVYDLAALGLCVIIFAIALVFVLAAVRKSRKPSS